MFPGRAGSESHDGDCRQKYKVTAPHVTAAQVSPFCLRGSSTSPSSSPCNLPLDWISRQFTFSIKSLIRFEVVLQPQDFKEKIHTRVNCILLPYSLPHPLSCQINARTSQIQDCTWRHFPLHILLSMTFVACMYVCL